MKLTEQWGVMTSLVKAADCEHPTKQAVTALRQGFKDYPDMWMIAGELMTQARLQTVDAAGMSPAMRESVKEGLNSLRNDLGIKTAPMLEKLLIDQVAMCWLRMSLAELNYTGKVMNGSYSLEIALFWEKRLSRAQARYLQACEALARVRRLAQVTPLQVNIGAKQVNVAGGVQVESHQVEGLES